MLYIHKRSPTPIDHWPVRRHGGANNLGDQIPGKFLLLWNVDIVHREGAWHYIFEFDVRNSLNISELGRLMSKEKSYPNDMDWKTWLGPDYTIISAAVRAEILNMSKDVDNTGPRITDIHELPHGKPIPGRNETNWYEVDLPDDFVLGLTTEGFEEEIADLPPILPPSQGHAGTAPRLPR